MLNIYITNMDCDILSKYKKDYLDNNFCSKPISKVRLPIILDNSILPKVDITESTDDMDLSKVDDIIAKKKYKAQNNTLLSIILKNKAEISNNVIIYDGYIPDIILCRELINDCTEIINNNINIKLKEYILDVFNDIPDELINNKLTSNEIITNIVEVDNSSQQIIKSLNKLNEHHFTNDNKILNWIKRLPNIDNKNIIINKNELKEIIDKKRKTILINWFNTIDICYLSSKPIEIIIKELINKLITKKPNLLLK